MLTIEQILGRVKQYLPGIDEARVKHAYEFADAAHEGQKRYSNEPYINHPLATALLLTDFHPDEDSIIAALLHDVAEDTERTLDEIEKRFGPVVSELVSGTQKLSKVRSYGDASQIENLQKMFLAMAKDFRVVLIKLCDRLHNIQTLADVPKHKHMRIARETLEIYAPIASRLGIYRLKTLLEDHSFKFVNPKVYSDIEEQLRATDKFRENYIKEAVLILRDLLAKEGLKADVTGRIKGIYSIYHKLQRKNKSYISEIFDLFAMRIIIPDIYKYGKEFAGPLYTVLGIIHSNFTPLAHRFKDYIAVPKINGYRSLHTTVIGLGPKTYTDPTEIQIRNESMHEEAEYGVAAHWLYETAKGSSMLIPQSAYENQEDAPQHFRAESGVGPAALKRHIDWLKGLSQLKEEIKDRDEYFKNLQFDIFSDRIFVFTPRGDVKDLPKGATPVDFAYAVHSHIGNHCYGAKVNGNIAPLNHGLKNGDVVEILTKKNAEPSQNWLSFVKTRSAVNRIQSWFKAQNRDKNIKAGRELLNRHMAHFGRPSLSPDLGLLRIMDGKKLNFQEREEILADIGRGVISPNAVCRRIFTLDEILCGVRRKFQKKARAEPVSSSSAKKILVAGRPDLPYRLANCCRPSFKDEIGAFVTGGKGMTIHKKICKVFRNLSRKRKQDAKWVDAAGKNAYRVKITIELRDRVGFLRDVGQVFTSLRLNIENIVTHEHDKRHEGQIDVAVIIRSYEELEKLLAALELIPGVSKVYLSG